MRLTNSIIDGYMTWSHKEKNKSKFKLKAPEQTFQLCKCICNRKTWSSLFKENWIPTLFLCIVKGAWLGIMKHSRNLILLSLFSLRWKIRFLAHSWYLSYELFLKGTQIYFFNPLISYTVLNYLLKSKCILKNQFSLVLYLCFT